MSGLVRTGRLIAPAATARINWSHPLTAGLYFATAGGVIHLGSGGTTNGVVHTQTGEAGAALGPGLYGNAETTSYDTAGFAGTGPWSMHAVYTMGNYGANTQLMLMSDVTPGAATWDRALRFTTGPVPDLFVYDGADRDCASATTVAPGEVANLTGVSNTGLTLYHNGKVTTGVASNNGYNGYSSPRLVVGRGITVPSRMDGVLHAGYVWRDRVLTAAEADWLLAEPFAFYEEDSPQRYFSIGPAPAAAYTGIPAPAWKANGTPQENTVGVTVPWPTHVTDDIGLLLIESCGGEAATLTTANGFAAVTNSPSATGTTTLGTRITAFWCRATSGAMSSPVVADPGNHVYALIMTFSGCAPTGNPWDVTAAAVKASASTSMTLPAVTTAVNNTLIVLTATRDDDNAAAAGSSPSNANLASLTEQFDLGTIQGNGGGIMVWTGTKATPGDTGTTSATVTSSINAYLTIALRPPPGSPPPRRGGFPLALLAR